MIDARGGVHFAYNPGVAETLDMRVEGETLGFLGGKHGFHAGRECSVKKSYGH